MQMELCVNIWSYSRRLNLQSGDSGSCRIITGRRNENHSIMLPLGAVRETYLPVWMASSSRHFFSFFPTCFDLLVVGRDLTCTARRAGWP